MLKETLFGKSGGFGEGKNANEHYYSQGMQRSQFGMSTGYAVTATKSSDDISGLGQVKYFADKDGKIYAQDSNGKLYRETNAGSLDFGNSIHTPTVTSSGRGLIYTQKGYLLVFADTTITKYESAFVESWKTGLTAGEHPPDTYEDMVVFPNGCNVGVLYSDDSINVSAFSLPASMSVVATKGGKNGVLVGANLGFTGYLILWDPNFADRSRAPWIKVSGTVQAIESVDDGWIVVTQKGVLWTNGYSFKVLSALFDDPLGINAFTVYPQGVLALNDKVFILNSATGYQRLKAGVLVLDLPTKLFEFVPLSTLNTNSVTCRAIFSAKSTTQNIVVGYTDTKNYFGSLGVTSGSRAVLISEPVASGPNDKVCEAVVLNLSPSTIFRGKGAFSFDVSVKVSDMQRPLWGIQSANADSAAANLIRIDGTNTSLFKAQAGDEVTILDGTNAGKITHISSIANAGTNTETWTLTESLTGITAAGVSIQVEPYRLLSKKTFTNETSIPDELFFNDTEKHRGKQFLVKVVFEGITNIQLEMHPSKFIYDDLQTTS